MSGMGNVVKIKRSTPLAGVLRIVDAQKHINKVAEDSANIILTKHAKDRMYERDFSVSEVYQILRTGIIREKPQKEKKGGWSYQVEAIGFCDNRDAAVITVIMRENELVIKTVMWLDL